MRLVTIEVLDWCTPRPVMQPWRPSMTTATPVWLKRAIQGVSDLRCNSLLNLQTPGIGLDDPCQLGDTDDSVARQIADMGPPDDRRHVVLAVRNEPDVTQQNHFVIPGEFLGRPLQQLVRIFAISGNHSS